MRILSVLLLFNLVYNSYAQEITLNKITKEDLLETHHHLDSVANSVVLYHSGVIDINIKSGSSLKVFKRIKLYNNKAYKYATIKLPYRVKSENITNVKAFTYNLIDGKIVKEKVNDIIKEETTDYYNQVKFTFPNLKNGSIIEYSYEQLFYHSYLIPKWSFQGEIPVNVSKLEIVTPLNIKYSERISGSHKIEKKTENLLKKIKYSYIAKDLPGLKDEPFVNNIKNHRSTIKHELSYIVSDINGKVRKYAFNWGETALRLQESSNFGIELNKKNYFKTDLELLTNNNSPNEENLEKIFNYVKNRMTCNNRKGVFVSNKLKKVYKDKTGSHSEINLMLTSMLREIGFKSNPILISTIGHGIPSTEAFLTDYNYVISSVELEDGKTIFLDASNKFTRPNLLPRHCLNWYGRLIRPDGTTKQVNLNPAFPSADDINLNIELKEDGTVTGSYNRRYTKQLALDFRNSKINNQNQKTKIENKYGLNIEDYELKNMDSLSKALIENFSFTKKNAADIINDKIYFNPLLFLSLQENPFKQDITERQFPINYTFPRSKSVVINFKTPNNYKVVNLPEQLSLIIKDYNGSYNFEIKQINNTSFELKTVRKINKSIINPRFYKDLKNFYSNIVEKETDKIVLTKK